jgi:hypothetical protein
VRIDYLTAIGQSDTRATHEVVLLDRQNGVYGHEFYLLRYMPNGVEMAGILGDYTVSLVEYIDESGIRTPIPVTADTTTHFTVALDIDSSGTPDNADLVRGWYTTYYYAYQNPVGSCVFGVVSSATQTAAGVGPVTAMLKLIAEISSGQVEAGIMTWLETMANLVSDRKVWGCIVDFLEWLVEKLGQSVSFTYLSLDQPAILHVYDTQGRHVGITSDGQVQNQIPNAFYVQSESLAPALIVLDASESYHVVVEGQATASGTLEIRQCSDGRSSRSTYSLPLTENIAAQMHLEPGNMAVLELDNDRDGTVDETIESVEPSLSPVSAKTATPMAVEEDEPTPETKMSKDVYLILVGVAIALVIGVVVALAQRALSLRAGNTE